LGPHAAFLVFADLRRYKPRNRGEV
jgi:hypothetical protein